MEKRLTLAGSFNHASPLLRGFQKPGVNHLASTLTNTLFIKDEYTVNTATSQKDDKASSISSNNNNNNMFSKTDPGIAASIAANASYSPKKSGSKSFSSTTTSPIHANKKRAGLNPGGGPILATPTGGTGSKPLDIESSKGWSNLINHFQGATVETDKGTMLRRLSDMGATESTTSLVPLGKRKTLLLPQRRQDEGKLTVVLDMDETLIHSEFLGPVDYRQEEMRLHVSGKRPPDFSIKLYENSPDQEEELVHVYKRPGLDNFLRKLCEICEPVIFTASLPLYARPILKHIDPKRRCKSRLYRNATIKYAGYPHVKSLKNLGRDLRRVILVDNSPYAMAADPDNAVPIKSYYDDTEDRELEYLYEIIKEMVELEDVRPHLKRKFNFAETIRSLLPT